ncbi:hypothetical protein ABZ413_24915 [Nocardia rhamnosiphila]|uniref:hypothetical protein n=1 Tax=Nocardia rhamnosiphila TaxID=426716 RepID=UPI0033D86873
MRRAIPPLDPDIAARIGAYAAAPSRARARLAAVCMKIEVMPAPADVPEMGIKVVLVQDPERHVLESFERR